MASETLCFEDLEFSALERHLGFDKTCMVMRALERLEGIEEAHVSRLSYTDRMRNVISTMKYNIRFQTRH